MTFAPRLTLMTSNIHGGFGTDGVLDLERLARVTRAAPRRIDYVLMRGGIRAHRAQVIEWPASDHAALVAEVALPV